MDENWNSVVNHLTVGHGITHRLELGVSKAIKDHLRLKRLNDVFFCLNYSAKGDERA